MGLGTCKHIPSRVHGTWTVQQIPVYSGYAFGRVPYGHPVTVDSPFSLADTVTLLSPLLPKQLPKKSDERANR